LGYLSFAGGVLELPAEAVVSKLHLAAESEAVQTHKKRPHTRLLFGEMSPDGPGLYSNGPAEMLRERLLKLILRP
jgi:hypothetical protein